MSKGQTSLLPDIVAVFVLILVLISFSLILGLQALNPVKEKQVINSISREEVSIDLINFLRSENNIINEWYFDKSLEGELKNRINEIFSRIYGRCYSFRIYEDDRLIFINGNEGDIIKDVATSINIPLENKKILKVELNPSFFFRAKKEDFVSKRLEKDAIGLCGVT